MSSLSSCTGQGKYSLPASAVGPIPALPQSSGEASFTPKIGLYGVKENGGKATISISVWASQPDDAEHVPYNDLGLGDTFEFKGYTLRVTSICEADARLDLIAGPK